MSTDPFEYSEVPEAQDADDKAVDAVVSKPPVSETVQAAPAEPAEPPKRKRSTKIDALRAKIAKAQVYWTLIQNGLFDPTDPAEQAVHDELEDFLETQLEKLMASKGGDVSIMAALVTQAKKPGPATKATPKVVRGPQTPKPTAVTASFEEQPDDIISTITDDRGMVLQDKRYRKQIDPDSGREYYLCFVKQGVHGYVGDGNKYELGVNPDGGQFFRVLSQQTLPSHLKFIPPQTNAQISAASHDHALRTLESMSRNPVNGNLMRAIDIFKGQ